MKTARLLLGAFSVLFAALSAEAQSTFENLNFESADLTIIPAGRYGGPVSIGLALPGWSGYIGTNQVTEVLHNNLTLGSTSIDILGPDWNGEIIDGNYSVLLQGAFTDGAASISQTGLIPAGTESLYFDAGALPGNVNVFIGDQSIPFTAVEEVGNYTVYGADIAAWAGKTEELTFSAPNIGGYNNVSLDDISFSTTVVTPEPNTLALAVMGGLALAARRWHKKG